MKKIVVLGLVGALTTVFASDVCDKTKIDSLFSVAYTQGAKLLKTETSIDVAGACDVYMEVGGKVDLVYAKLDSKEFIAGGTLIAYDEVSKQYYPKNHHKLNSLMQDLENKKMSKAVALLKDKKELQKYYDVAKTEYTKKDNKNNINKKYDVLIFESLVCPYCVELNKKIENSFEKENLKISKYYLPLSMEDYNNLKVNYYPSEDALKNAIELKGKLEIDGVPLVIVRDAKTKEFVEILRNTASDVGFNKLKEYLK